jgi:hypothetical protein
LRRAQPIRAVSRLNPRDYFPNRRAIPFASGIGAQIKVEEATFSAVHRMNSTRKSDL